MHHPLFVGSFSDETLPGVLDILEPHSAMACGVVLIGSA